jgi:hypothetical protein
MLNRYEYSSGARRDCDGLQEVDSDHCEPLDLETDRAPFDETSGVSKDPREAERSRLELLASQLAALFLGKSKFQRTWNRPELRS